MLRKPKPDVETIRLSGRNRDVLVQALLNPPPASPSLIRALRRYRASLKSGARTPGA
jgi:hypothetical protein